MKIVHVQLNSKIAIGGAVGGIAIILAIVIMLPESNLLQEISTNTTPLSENLGSGIQPLEIQLNELSIISVSEKEAILNLKFTVTSPNKRPVILQMIKYEIFENDVKVKAGQIGERLIGMVTGSKYFTLLQGYPTTLGEKVTIKNTGNTPELWTALNENTPKWKVMGEAFYSTTTALTGMESSTTFDFHP